MAQSSIIKALALDTSTPRGSVALLAGDQLVAELRLHSLETHSARLLRSIRFLLETAGWNLGELNLVATGIGPGSFTGIRIGIATALGLAHTMNIPFAGASGLDALARQAPCRNGSLGVVLDAQRSQVYYAEYETSSGVVRQVRRPGLWFPHDLRPHLHRRHLALVGDGAERYIDLFRSPGEATPELLITDLFIAASIGRIAMSRKRSWRSRNRLECNPLYIRPPDAKKWKGRR